MKRLLIVMLLFVSPAFAQNEYLNNGSGHCSSATLEPYVEQRWGTNNPTGTSTSGYNDDNTTVGIRLRIELGTTCTKEFKETLMTNERLKQQLELLKLCARYQNLDLGSQFKDVKKMCKDVKLKKKAKTLAK